MLAWPASSRVNPLPQGCTALETCAVPVGAGLPAKRPAQANHNGRIPANAPVQIPPTGGNPPAFLRKFAPSLGVYPSQIRHLHPSWAFWHHPCY
ncbi:hypothetical protein EFK07_14490 [Pseudomonas putida]|uniref:Uncharacterized protein n=1 Tax=Pseudomonas putida TaxID=303 RepID=A0A3M8T4H5_PSEPU|nr:hypothetical protein EFK07_14490 [Pseudomonas putida]